MLAGKDEVVVKKMEELGKYLGVIFQIKDDEIGLFGEEKEIGKAVGGDIKERKKTLYYLYLFDRAKGG
ncbi:MAG: polyprenyl synthetase family protein, partial [Deltaproteobacteria bacterium]